MKSQLCKLMLEGVLRLWIHVLAMRNLILQDDYAVFNDGSVGMAAEMSHGDVSRVRRFYNCTDAGMKTDARRAASLKRLKILKSKNCSWKCVRKCRFTNSIQCACILLPLLHQQSGAFIAKTNLIHFFTVIGHDFQYTHPRVLGARSIFFLNFICMGMWICRLHILDFCFFCNWHTLLCDYCREFSFHTTPLFDHILANILEGID